MPVDIAVAFGATADRGVGTAARFEVYVADCDRRGKRIWRFKWWCNQILHLLGDIAQGASSYPPTTSRYLADGVLIRERSVLVYAYIMDMQVFETRIPELRALLHAYGRRTNQHSVGFAFAGAFFKIVEYDK